MPSELVIDEAQTGPTAKRCYLFDHPREHVVVQTTNLESLECSLHMHRSFV